MSRSDAESIKTLERVLNTARHIAQTIHIRTGNLEPLEVFEFCRRHGYAAIPRAERDFVCHQWLSPHRPGSHFPLTQEERKQSLGIAVCFSDGPILGESERNVFPDGSREWGCLLEKDRLLVVYDVDILPVVERALIFLHEGWHAYHRYGPACEPWPAVRIPEAEHETHAWRFHLRLMAGFGGAVWTHAVLKTADVLGPLYASYRPLVSTPKLFLASSYPQELDAIFGPTSEPAVRHMRDVWLSLAVFVHLTSEAGAPELDAVKHFRALFEQ